VVFGLFIFQCGKITDADAQIERVPSEASSPCSTPEERDSDEDGYAPVKVEIR
jgi:hypothetical protein